VGGVCAGLAEGFHIDALWVRVALLILIFVQGIGVFLYIVLWLVMPERMEAGGQRSGFEAMTADIRHVWGELQHPTAGKAQAGASAAPPSRLFHNQNLVFGLILAIIGLALLGGNVGVLNRPAVWPSGPLTPWIS